jgi:allantoinase
MLQPARKILTNVFISAEGNKLKLVDIIFDDRIKQVVPLLNSQTEWSEISSKEKLKAFTEKLPPIFQYRNSKIYDGNFLFLIPGAIDPHVHFNTPGFEFRDDIQHASTAAAYGGVTTVIDMPCTSIPPVTSVENLNIKLSALEGKSLVDYCLWGGICGNDFDEQKDLKMQVDELAKAGVAGFKTYLISGMDSFRDLTPERLLVAAEYVKELNKPIAIHAEDKNRINTRSQKLIANGETGWKAFVKARDSEAEARAISTLIEIASKCDCRFHIVHLSSKAGLELIRKAKAEALKFSTETCPHYLAFTQNDFNDKIISNYLKTSPPVKTDVDKKALWEGLRDGTISFVTTDHAGCNPAVEKSSKNFWEVYSGIPGVEHRVPFLLSEGFLKGRLTLEQTVKLLSTNAGEYFGIVDKGSLDVGKDADFALINMWSSEKIKSNNMHSKGKYTPFEGREFSAIVEQTFLRGRVIMDRRNELEEQVCFGEYIII